MEIYRANPLDLNGFITRGATLTFPQKCPKHLANSSTLMAFWGEVSRPSPTQQLGAMGSSPWIPKKTDGFRFESVRNKRPKNPKQKSYKIPTTTGTILPFFRWEAVSCQRSREKNLQLKISGDAPPVSQKKQAIKVSKLSDQQRATSNTSLFSSFLHMTFPCTLSSQTPDHYAIATQHPQSAWQGHALQIGHVLQILVTVATKRQALQTVWQGHGCQTLAKVITKSQILQTVRQGDAFQTLVEVTSKSQALQTVWQGHVIQTLVERITKSQILQTDKAELLNFPQSFRTAFFRSTMQPGFSGAVGT